MDFGVYEWRNCVCAILCLLIGLCWLCPVDCDQAQVDNYQKISQRNVGGMMTHQGQDETSKEGHDESPMIPWNGLSNGRSFDYGGWEMPEVRFRYPTGWIARQDSEDEEKKGDGGLYGLFGLLGLLGILPFLPLLLLALLLIPIPIITGRGRSGNLSHQSTLNSLWMGHKDIDRMWSGRGDTSELQRILSAITKDYSSSIQKISNGSLFTGCVERVSCAVSRLVTTYSPPHLSMNTLKRWINRSDNKLMGRIKHGMMASGKECKVFKCNFL